MCHALRQFPVIWGQYWEGVYCCNVTCHKNSIHSREIWSAMSWNNTLSGETMKVWNRDKNMQIYCAGSPSLNDGRGRPDGAEGVVRLWRHRHRRHHRPLPRVRHAQDESQVHKRHEFQPSIKWSLDTCVIHSSWAIRIAMQGPNYLSEQWEPKRPTIRLGFAEFSCHEYLPDVHWHWHRIDNRIIDVDAESKLGLLH